MSKKKGSELSLSWGKEWGWRKLQSVKLLVKKRSMKEIHWQQEKPFLRFFSIRREWEVMTIHRHTTCMANNNSIDNNDSLCNAFQARTSFSRDLKFTFMMHVKRTAVKESICGSRRDSVVYKPPSIDSGSMTSLAGSWMMFGLEVTTRGESCIEVAGLVWNKTVFSLAVTVILPPLLFLDSSKPLDGSGKSSREGNK